MDSSWLEMSVVWEVSMKKDKFWMFIAWNLPRKLVLWAAVRLIAHATTGKYGNTEVPLLTAMEALKRWDEEVEIDLS